MSDTNDLFNDEDFKGVPRAFKSKVLRFQDKYRQMNEDYEQMKETLLENNGQLRDLRKKESMFENLDEKTEALVAREMDVKAKEKSFKEQELQIKLDEANKRADQMYNLMAISLGNNINSPSKEGAKND